MGSTSGDEKMCIDSFLWVRKLNPQMKVQWILNKPGRHGEILMVASGYTGG